MLPPSSPPSSSHQLGGVPRPMQPGLPPQFAFAAYAPQIPHAYYPPHAASFAVGPFSPLPSVPALPPLAQQHRAAHAAQMQAAHTHQQVQQQQQQQPLTHPHSQLLAHHPPPLAYPYPYPVLSPPPPSSPLPLPYPGQSPRILHLAQLASQQMPPASEFYLPPAYSSPFPSGPPPASPPSRPRTSVTVPVSGGFYESATISSTLRTRSHPLAEDIDAPLVRGIDILSPESHSISDASEVMLRPRLTTLEAYKERGRPASVQQKRRPNRISSSSALRVESPLSAAGRSESRSGLAWPSTSRLDGHRPSASLHSFNHRSHTHDLSSGGPSSPSSTQPHSAFVNPSPPRYPQPPTHQRSNSYFSPSHAKPASHSLLRAESHAGSSVGLVPPRSPMALRSNLFTASPTLPLTPPPVTSPHPSQRTHTKRLRSKDVPRLDSGGVCARDEDDTKSGGDAEYASATDDSVTPSFSHQTSVTTAATEGETDQSAQLLSESASASESASVSVLSSAEHSRRPSSGAQLQHMLAQHLRAQIADLEADERQQQQVKDKEDGVREGKTSYLHGLVTASSASRLNSHRSSDASADASVSSPQAASPAAEPVAVTADEPPAIDDLLGSNLAPVPESGIALDASLTSTQRAAAQDQLLPETDPPQADPESEAEPDDVYADDAPPSSALPPSISRRVSHAHVREGSLSLDSLSAAPPISTSMGKFWAMHDHAGEQAESESDSETESESESEKEVDEFDSNPLHMHARNLRQHSRSLVQSSAPHAAHRQSKFQVLQDSSSSDSDEEDRQIARTHAEVDRGFEQVMRHRKGKGKVRRKSKSTAKDPPASAAEMLSQSLNHIARAQIQQEFSLQAQKKQVLGWFQRSAAEAGATAAAAALTEENGNDDPAQLAQKIKRAQKVIRVLREARKSKRMEAQKARDESEARSKVFAMLGSGDPSDQQNQTRSESSPTSTLFTSSDMVMSYIEIEQLIQAGDGALSVFQHLVAMEAAGDVKFDTPAQLISAVKVLALPIEVTDMDIVQHEVRLAHLPANAERFVLKHSEVEIEMHRVMKLSKAHSTTRRAARQRAARSIDGNIQAVDQGDNLSSVMVDEGAESVPLPPRSPTSSPNPPLPEPSPALISQMKAQQLIFEDQQAREQLLDRLTIQDNNVLFDGDKMMTPMQVELLIGVGKGSKPTLRHIVQMEVEKVKFQDPEQLISAVTVLTIPAELEYGDHVNMSLIRRAVSQHRLPESAEKYVLKHSEVDIEMHKVEINLKRHSGNQMKFLLENAHHMWTGSNGGGQAALSASGNPRRFKEVPKSATLLQSTMDDLDEGDSTLTVELVDMSPPSASPAVAAASNAFFQLSAEEQEKERLRVEEELARREVHKRLLPLTAGSSLDPSSALVPYDSSRRSTRLFVEGSTPMTPTQVDKLIEVGKGSKPTLRHIVQMEVERVQFSDPAQLITAVKVLSVPIQSTHFNLERIEREITQGRVKLPPSAVEYVMKHSEVQLEMHQVERIGLALSGNAGNLQAMMGAVLDGAARTAQVVSIEEDDGDLLEEEYVAESPEQVEKLRDEVARAEVHLRLENARTRLFHEPVRMSSLQVDELIEEGNGGQPTLRHIVELEVEEIKFDSPQQLITAVKVMNLPAKRNSGPMLDADREVRTINESAEATRPKPVTQQDVAHAAAEARLPPKITEYVLRHSEVQLEMAKVVPIRSRTEFAMPRIASLGLVDEGDDLFMEDNGPAHMRAQMRAMEREMKILQSDVDDSLQEEWVSQTAENGGNRLAVPANSAQQSRRSSLVTFPMTSELVEELIEESQAGDYVVTHLEKLSRDANQKPFNTKEELVKAVADEHAAYMEVEAHARIDLHHRLEHDRPSSVFKLGAKMQPAEVDHLIEEGRGAVPTLKHIVRMEHSNVKFKEPSELVSAVQVLSLPLDTITIDDVSESVRAAHLPAEATKFVIKYMAQELHMFEVDADMDEVAVEEGAAESHTVEEAKTIEVKPVAAVPKVMALSYASASPSVSPVPVAIERDNPNRRSLVAYPRVLSPGLDESMVEEVGRRSVTHTPVDVDRPASEAGTTASGLNSARRAARNSGQLPLAFLTTPTYMQGASSLHAPHLIPARAGRHSLNAPPPSGGHANIHNGGGSSLPSSLTSTMNNMPLSRKSLLKYGGGQLLPSPISVSFQPPLAIPPGAHASLAAPTSQRVHEAELRMEDDDPALLTSSGSHDISRRHSASHSPAAAVPHTISLRPAFSQQPSPSISMHNTFSPSQVAFAMNQQEDGHLSYDDLRHSPDFTADVFTPPMTTRSPALPSDFINSPASDASSQVRMTTISPDAVGQQRALSPRSSSPNPAAGRVLHIHPSSATAAAAAATAAASAAATRQASPTSDTKSGDAQIRRISLTTPLSVGKDLHPSSIASSPDRPVDSASPPPPVAASPQGSRSPSSLDRYAHTGSDGLPLASPPALRRSVSPHVLNLPLPQSGPNSLTNTMVPGGGGVGTSQESRSNSPTFRHSPSHSQVMMPFTVMVTEASRHASRLPSRAPTPSITIRAITPPPSQSTTTHANQSQAQSQVQSQAQSQVQRIDSPYQIDSIATTHTQMEESLSQRAASPVHLAETPTNKQLHISHTAASSSNAPSLPSPSTGTSSVSVDSSASSFVSASPPPPQSDGSELTSPAESPRVFTSKPPAPSPQPPPPPITPASPPSSKRTSNNSGTTTPSAETRPILAKVPSPILSQRIHGNSDSHPGTPKQTGSGTPRQSSSPRQSTRTSPHSSPPMSRTATLTGMPVSPRAPSLKSRIAIAAAANEKAAKSKSSPKTTPRSSPSQSLQPSPMQSLTVSPIASPRSSGGSANYSNMAATVTSRSRVPTQLTVTPPVTDAPSPLPPLSPRRPPSGTQTPNTTLGVPHKPESRRSLSGSGSTLKNVLEIDADTTTSPSVQGRERAESNASNAASNRSHSNSISAADDPRIDVERRKNEILSLHADPSLTPTPSAGSLHVPTGSSGSAPNSKRGSRRNNTVTEWGADNEDEIAKMTSSARKKATSKSHRKAGSVFTASYLQPTVSSSGSASVSNTRDNSGANTAGSGSSGGGSSNLSSSGYTPSFLQPTQSHALKAIRVSSKSSTPVRGTSGKAPRTRRKESKLFTESPIEESTYEHRRLGSTEVPDTEDEDARPTADLDRATSVDAKRATAEKELTEAVPTPVKKPEETDHTKKPSPSAAAAPTSATPPAPSAARKPWQPVRPISLAPTLTEEELAHQNEIERVRAENERRRKLKEQAALLEAQRLQALANDPAEQLRLRREKRKNEFRARKEAERSEEQQRRLAEEQRQREAAAKAQQEQELAEKLEAERIAAEGRADMERRIAARAAKEHEYRQKVIADFERKKAEAAEAQRIQEEADRIANMPKYLATGTVAAVARMGDTQKLRNGQTAAEYLAEMRLRSETLREKAAANKRQLEQAKLAALHERDDALATHIAEIRKSKAELYESEQLELQLSTAEKDAKAQEALRLLKEQSEADTAQKHKELTDKILQAQLKHHTTDAEKARELEQIYKEHAEEAQRKAEEVNSKLESIKTEKARENELMLARARALKLEYEANAEDELRALVEARELMREKAAAVVQANAYTPKVGVGYFADNDLLHLAGLPANHPMMLNSGVSRIDQAGNAVWAAGGGGGNLTVTNVGSSAPATYAHDDRAGLDSGRNMSSLVPGTPVRSARTVSTGNAADFANDDATPLRSVSRVMPWGSFK